MIRVRNASNDATQSEALQPVNLLQPPSESRMRVYTGDVATSTRPATLDALLGSCVSVCLYDPYLRAGGINHILLPGSGLDTRFGVHAMELLINELMKQGADRRRFIAKAFGGANVLAGLVPATIGDDNAEFVREFLATERIPLVAERLGGTHAVHLHFKTDTGKAVVRTVDGSRLPKIIRAETSYWRSHCADWYVSGEITLF
jgi:chemotaxis receptor (MCP) glutamine deamidase CheD